MKIITITLNPAFDIHCHIDHFVPFHENLAQVTMRDAGGKGVNISRALTGNQISNTALVVLGEENEADFVKCLEADRIFYHKIAVPGRIRENITIHTTGADETRISFPGFLADERLLASVEKEIQEIWEEGAYITFTGRVPEGIGMEAVKAFLKKLKTAGAKLVIDSRSFTKEDLTEVAPWLIKPNQEEISHYAGCEIQGLADAVSVAKDLHRKGIENVMISLGSQGALIVGADGGYIARAPKVTAHSTIGAGDSSIAGFLAAAVNGTSCAEMLASAVAYGTAACLTEGTRPPCAKDISGLLKKIKIQKAQ